MKKTIMICMICSGCIHLSAQVNSPQNKPGTTMLNSNSNNSISGVNPNGNPGTILYNNSNSAAVNNTLITPNTAVTTTIITTPNNSPIVSNENKVATPVNPNTTIITTTAVNPNVSSKTAVETKIEDPVAAKPVADKNPANNNAATTTTVVNVTGSTLTGLKPMSSSPVLTNYVPEIIVTKLKSAYGEKLYDITMLKKSDNQLLYIVRVHKNGAYITHYLDAEGNVIK